LQRLVDTQRAVLEEQRREIDALRNRVDRIEELADGETGSRR